MTATDNATPRQAVYAVVGPTATGKTKAAFELAKLIGGEIVSVDSRQVYRYLDVGTDKISHADRRAVPHHLIDVADPDETFTAAMFVEMAWSAISRVSSRGKIPILAGGTPLYYRALEGGLLSQSLPKDEAVRQRLRGEAALHGTPALHDRLARMDPESASRIGPNDLVRITRALELYELTGRTAAELYAVKGKVGAPVDLLYFGIRRPRPLLYERIARRVNQQFRSGYVEEVQWLLQNGYSRDLPALRGFGYREIARYLDGKITLEEAIEGDIRSTKAFSRRQDTWFKHFSPILWYDASECDAEKIADDMGRVISGGDFMERAGLIGE
ncbi:MAG: tRNA (adenosine(37)-N6)-dimethylallyltransferase MiaA [Synergistaceae bacterium]|jgi:tRNA dimethylallyltransferase|nr:tRNA (adenosine(37)-N6)-dimethylallyltransferase MiaA [Synergistaceae bacterium]